MKRRAFLTTTASSAFASLGLSAETPATPAAVDSSILSTPAVIMAPRSDGFEIVCAVRQLCTGWVEVRNAENVLVEFKSDPFGFVHQSDSILRLKVSGLTPGQSYTVRVIVEAGNVREETPWKKFVALDPKKASSRFVVWNDTHERNETIQALHAITPNADFLLWNGDTCNDWIEESKLIPTLLNPGNCDITDGRPLLLNWGNHDVRGKWAFKVPDCVATPTGRPFYAFRNGPVAVICLHTGEDKPDDHPSFKGRVAFEKLRKEQAAWLKTITALPEMKSAPHKIVFCHIPLRWTAENPTVDYAAGGYDAFSRMSREAWNETLVAWGAQVVISGHTHREAWIPGDEKFPYAQLVSGGPAIDKARWIEGIADDSGLRLIVRDVKGVTSFETTFPKLV